MSVLLPGFVNVGVSEVLIEGLIAAGIKDISVISNNTSVGKNAPVGLYGWLSQDQISKNYTMFCAGGVLVAVPVTILFMCLQRYYVEGVTGGAVKG